MSKLLAEEKETLVYAYKKGAKVAYLASIYQISKPTVRRYLEQAGVELRSKHAPTDDGLTATQRFWAKQKANNTHKETARKYSLKSGYGLSFSQFKKRVEQQKGLCAICQSFVGDLLHVDHDHTSGEIRGLLCPPCNTGLGLFRDNTEALFRAIAYLKN